MMSIHRSLAVCLLLALSISLGLAQAPPRNLEGQFQNGFIELQWEPPDSEVTPQYYTIYRNVNNDFTFSLIGSTSDKHFEDNAISANNLYRYKVRGVYQDSSQSVPSNVVEIFTHMQDGIAPPRELEGQGNEPTVSLRWVHPQSNFTPSFYNVYRGRFDFHDIKFVGSTNDTTFDDATVELHTLYHYGVTAVYFDSVESFPSNIIEVFTASQDSLPDSNVVDIHFISEPKHFALINQLYQYDADVVTKPPDVPVRFHLEDAPDGMTINDSTGLVEWTPTSTGVFEVEIIAHPRDERLGGAEQEYHLFVLSGLPGSVEGIVRNPEGEGLPNVRIKLFDVSFGQFVLRTVTDDTGHYRFPFVNPATYFVRAKPENDLYLPQWYDSVSRIEDATPVTVPETTIVTIDFTLQRRDTTRSTLSGTVMDDSSHPLGNARVLVFRAEHDSLWGDMYDDYWNHHREPLRDAETDSDGHYSFRLRQGTYIVTAKAEGHLPQFWDHKPTPLEADRIMLTQNIDGIDFNLSPRPEGKGIIAGVIYNGEDSTGLESHVVAFQKDSVGHFTGFVAFTRSDSIGQYALEHLPNGCYVVLAKDGDDFVPTFYNTSGGSPFLDSATCVAVNGDAVAGIDIYMHPDSVDGLNSVAGQVVSNSPGSGMSPESVMPVNGALVTITKASNNMFVSSATSGQDGNYTAEGLPPGTYNVVFQKAGKTTASVPISVSYVNNAPTTTMASAQLTDDNGSGPLGTMNVRSHWNMVSLPVTVADPHRSAVFPTANSNAFRFSESAGYLSTDELNYTEGYWLKFSSAQVLALQGVERTSQVIPVFKGWNMIGSLSTPIQVTSLQMSQQGLISSSVFGYNGSYFFAGTIAPGSGYWIKAAANGTITLNTNSAVPKSAPSIVPELAKLNTLTIRDASGNAQILYFGNDNRKIDLGKTELPPVAPSEAFDARFSSQRIVELHSSRLQRTVSFPIIVQSAQTPMTISWTVNSEDFHYTLADVNGKALTASYLRGNGSIRLTSSEIMRLILNVQPNELPKQAALHQNYPNPFNPSTQISFDLPTASTVTLKVYNLLGQEVATILNNATLNAGEQSATFDASALPSGIYFYRLLAGDFVSVKKMVLVK